MIEEHDPAEFLVHDTGSDGWVAPFSVALPIDVLHLLIVEHNFRVRRTTMPSWQRVFPPSSCLRLREGGWDLRQIGSGSRKANRRDVERNESRSAWRFRLPLPVALS